MSVYNVPFTSNLQMWSPSSSVTIDYNFNTTVPFSSTQVPNSIQSRFFHHEPIMYPSACIICGLPHHPVPHTVMQYHTASPVITTPAPLEPTLSPSTLKSSHRRRRSRRQIKPHQKIALHFKYLSTKFFKIFSIVLKAPLTSRRHNIYPVKRDRVD